MDQSTEISEKEKIEELLKNYKSIKSEIRITIIWKLNDYSLPSVDYTNPSTSSGGDGKYSKIEDHIVRKCSEEDKVFKLIKIRDIIESGLTSLNEEKKNIIKYLYFEDLTQMETASRMDFSESTVSNRKREIIDILMSIGVLKAWDLWSEISI